MPRDDRIPTIHQFLKDCVNDSDLMEICLLHFGDVRHEFADGMALGTKILRLLDYCNRQGQIEELLSVLEKKYPKRYKEYFAKLGGSPPPPPPESWKPGPLLIIGGIFLVVLLICGLPKIIRPDPTETPTVTPTTINAPTVTPTLRAGAASLRRIDGMAMVYIPPGVFTMGSDANDTSVNNETFPVREVTLMEGFWIDRTEVTNAQFAAFLTARGNQREGEVFWLSLEDADVLIVESDGVFQPKSGFRNHPVIEVSWYGAAAYCDWVGAVLPTEAQWEYAARGRGGFIYPWGNESPDSTRLNYNRNIDRTTAVGAYPNGASWVGALDMVGNVWEWVNDWYEPDYYESAPSVNPTGPDNGTKKVLRGGSWLHDALVAQAAYRNGYPPTLQNGYVGFRCANVSNR
jgi:formylglycine-generating enzyme required for sulfatase activity